MKTMQAVVAMVVCAVLLTGGCTSSEGTKFNYATGNLSATLNANVQKSYDASLKALEQLQITPAEKAQDSLGAKIVAKTAADKKITISLKRTNDVLTAIVIEVGFVGDNTISQTIYTKIVENLNK